MHQQKKKKRKRKVDTSAAILITRVRQVERETPALNELYYLPKRAKMELKLLKETY